MKDYYAILGIGRQADAVEIKKSYRRLAVRYHPDKNPDAAAEQLFKEINEAYEVLSDPNQKVSYDLRLNNPFAELAKQSEPPRHRDPAYRRRRHGVNYKSERQRLHEMMAEYVPWAHKIIYTAFFVSSLLIIDFLLPTADTQELITGTLEKRVRDRRNTNSTWIINTDRGTNIGIPYKFSDNFTQGDTITVVASPILKIPESISSNIVVEIKRSIYGSFFFAPVVLLLSSSFGIYFRKRVDYAFNAGVVSFMVLMLTFIIYLMIH
jgi:hypothetical protein